MGGAGRGGGGRELVWSTYSRKLAELSFLQPVSVSALVLAEGMKGKFFYLEV